MAINKDILNQYMSEKKEIEELKGKINYLEKRIPKLQKIIDDIEEGHTVKDKVRGGEGGLQSFVIEGVQYNQWNVKKAELSFKKEMLEQRKALLKTLEMELMLRTKEVEEFIYSISDSITRRIISFRVIEGMTWKEIAEHIGGSNNENSVKKAYQRYIEANS